MKILLSAFACKPGHGSEPAVGMGIARIAATRHDVWVLTRPSHAAAMLAHPLPERLNVETVDIGGIAGRLEERNRVLGWYHYHRWQDAAGERAVALDREIGFDVVHHATYATYWARVGVARVPKPLVIGPVGGAFLTPPRLIGELGLPGLLADTARLGRRIAGLRPSVRADLSSAALVLAQNSATAALLPPGTPVTTIPNALIVDVATAFEQPVPGPRRREIAVVGQLIPLKGCRLAVRAVSELDDATTLCFYGEGPDRGRIERLADRLGVGHRVHFAGYLPRDELFRRVATAGLVLHPSLHDEASLAVAEALSLGTPVVTLATSGPAEVAAHWPCEMWRTVAPSWPAETGRLLGTAARGFLDDPPQVASAPMPPRTPFAAVLLEAYERTASAL